MQITRIDAQFPEIKDLSYCRESVKPVSQLLSLIYAKVDDDQLPSIKLEHSPELQFPVFISKRLQHYCELYNQLIQAPSQEIILILNHQNPSESYLSTRPAVQADIPKHLEYKAIKCEIESFLKELRISIYFIFDTIQFATGRWRTEEWSDVQKMMESIQYSPWESPPFKQFSIAVEEDAYDLSIQVPEVASAIKHDGRYKNLRDWLLFNIDPNGNYGIMFLRSIPVVFSMSNHSYDILFKHYQLLQQVKNKPLGKYTFSLFLPDLQLDFSTIWQNQNIEFTVHASDLSDAQYAECINNKDSIRLTIEDLIMETSKIFQAWKRIVPLETISIIQSDELAFWHYFET